jgi:hypothetical protein
MEVITVNARRIHDASYALAVTIVALIENLLREEEKRDAFEAVYEVAKLGFERYELAREHEHTRLHPLKPSEN